MQNSLFKSYISLTKPGIIFGNSLAAMAGFFLASKGHVHGVIFVSMLIGIALVIASACVCNNIIDQEIDAKMKRTKHRVLVSGTVSEKNAIIFAIILGILGIAVLAIFTNFLTVTLTLIGYFIYVVLYGIWKRRSIYGTLVGSFSGSIPLVIGYTCVTNRFDTGAFLLFIILMIWQLPHFYALAMFRADEYADALLPVFPVKKGMETTKKHILFYIIAFCLAAIMLTFFKYTGFIYLVVMLLISFIWLRLAVQGFTCTDNKRWGRSIFRFSLIVLVVFCIMLSLSSIIP